MGLLQSFKLLGACTACDAAPRASGGDAASSHDNDAVRHVLSEELRMLEADCEDLRSRHLALESQVAALPQRQLLLLMPPRAAVILGVLSTMVAFARLVLRARPY